MKRFAGLFAALDGTNATLAKVDAIARYLSDAPPSDAAWATFFLLGRRLKRLVPSRAIGQWALSATGLSEWLLSECYAVVGDGAETATLLLDQLPSSTAGTELTLTGWVEERIMPLRHEPADAAAGTRHRLDARARSLGAVHAPQADHRRASARRVPHPRGAGAGPGLRPARSDGGGEADGRLDAGRRVVPAAHRARRHRGRSITAISVLPRLAARRRSATPRRWRPHWDRSTPGWSNGSGMASARNWSGAAPACRSGRAARSSSRTGFPEIADAAAALPDGTVLDGEVLAYRDDRPLPFSALQQRIGR